MLVTVSEQCDQKIMNMREEERQGKTIWGYHHPFIHNRKFLNLIFDRQDRVPPYIITAWVFDKNIPLVHNWVFDKHFHFHSFYFIGYITPDGTFSHNIR